MMLLKAKPAGICLPAEEEEIKPRITRINTNTSVTEFVFIRAIRGRRIPVSSNRQEFFSHRSLQIATDVARSSVPLASALPLTFSKQCLTFSWMRTGNRLRQRRSPTHVRGLLEDPEFVPQLAFFHRQRTQPIPCTLSRSYPLPNWWS